MLRSTLLNMLAWLYCLKY